MTFNYRVHHHYIQMNISDRERLQSSKTYFYKNTHCVVAEEIQNARLMNERTCFAIATCNLNDTKDIQQ